jgi:arylamine N-acetyltransferase
MYAQVAFPFENLKELMFFPQMIHLRHQSLKDAFVDAG